MNYNEKEIIHALKSDPSNLNVYLEKLYISLYNKVCGYFKSRGLEEEEIRDLYQDAIISFYEAVRDDKYEYKSKLSSYLIAIMKNKWINTKKKQNLEIAYREKNKSEKSEIEYDNFEYNEYRINLVKSFMEQLKEDCRKILSLFYYNQLNMEELAMELGYANEQVARNKKSKCLGYLKNLIKNNSANG